MFKRTLLLLCLFAPLGCGHDRDHDEVVIEYSLDGSMERCYMLKSGDKIPSDMMPYNDYTRTRIKVVDGDWNEALKRVGLTDTQCAQLSH